MKIRQNEVGRSRVGGCVCVFGGAPDEEGERSEEWMRRWRSSSRRRASHCCNETEMNERHRLVSVLEAVNPSWPSRA